MDKIVDKIVMVNHDIPQTLVKEISEMKSIDFYDSGYCILGSGAYGRVYDIGGGYAVKLYYDAKELDGEILHKLQNCNIFPKLYAYTDRMMFMEKINGVRLAYVDSGTFIEKDWEHDLYKAYKSVITKGLCFSDVHANNIMVENITGRLRIVDVGCFYNEPTFYKSIDSVINNCREYCNRAKGVKVTIA